MFKDHVGGYFLGSHQTRSHRKTKLGHHALEITYEAINAPTTQVRADACLEYCLVTMAGPWIYERTLRYLVFGVMHHA